MVIYPVRVRGRNFNDELATKLEAYINEKVSKHNGDVLQFTYAEIARELKLDVEEICDVLFSVDGGHNGLTVHKRLPA